MRKLSLGLATVCVAALAMMGGAHAQDVPTGDGSESVAPSAPEKPWAVGVSQENKSKALALFETGNSFFARSQYSQALTEYRKAIEAWDHPAIRFNMAVCLINLGETLEAHENLTLGLKYKNGPLDDKLYVEGQTYMKLLEGRLSRVTISTEEAGAAVSLDGEALFTGPGKAERLLLSGKHQLIAQKENMLTHTQDLLLESGQTSEVKIKMLPLSEGVVMKRRWKNWKPWAVTGGGIGLAALGGVAYLLADSDFATYEARVGEACPMGCLVSDLSSDITSLEDRAKVESVVSTSLLVAGGALATTGLVMVFLNRPRAHQLENAPTPKQPALSMAPILGTDIIGLSSEVRF